MVGRTSPHRTYKTKREEILKVTWGDPLQSNLTEEQQEELQDVSHVQAVFVVIVFVCVCP